MQDSTVRPRLLIVGAGGFGREVYTWASQIPPQDREWQSAFFLDANPNALQAVGWDVPIIGDPESYMPTANDRILCAIGCVETKVRIFRRLSAQGATFATLVHPTSIVGPECHIGKGCILCPYTVLTCNVTVGDNTAINIHTGIGHDVVVGSHCMISGHVELMGHVTVGNQVFIGGHAAIIPSAQVGDGATVGAGSVVLRRVHPNTTVFGNPAKQIFVPTHE